MSWWRVQIKSCPSLHAILKQRRPIPGKKGEKGDKKKGTCSILFGPSIAPHHDNGCKGRPEAGSGDRAAWGRAAGGGRRMRRSINPLDHGIVIHAADERTAGVQDRLEKGVLGVAAIHDVKPSRLKTRPKDRRLRRVGVGDRGGHGHALENLELDVGLGGVLAAFGFLPQGPAGQRRQGRQVRAVHQRQEAADES